MSAIDNEIYKSKGKTIREFRKYKCISAEQLAAETNMAEGTIKNIESGASASFLTYYNIARALRIPLDALISVQTECDYVQAINATDMQIFVETYKSMPIANRKMLMNVIKSFRESNLTPS